jgi:hypothetical protein
LPAIVGRGDFYLGFHIEREVYGWLRLRPIDGMPTLAGSEFASHAIVVGVSEPAAWVLVGDRASGDRAGALVANRQTVRVGLDSPFLVSVD